METMSCKFTFILLVFISVVYVNGVDLENMLYGTLLQYNTSIEVPDSLICKNQCGQKTSICGCDMECERLGDCCYDYWKYCSPSTGVNLQEIEKLVEESEKKFECTATIIDYDKEFFDYNLASPVYPGLITKVNCGCYVDRTYDHSADEVLCMGLNVLLELETSSEKRKIYFHHYDKNTSVIYKNYYCAKCNGVPEERIKQLEIIAQADDPEFDFHFDDGQLIEDDDLSENCKIMYKKPMDLLIYRPSRIENWMIVQNDILTFKNSLFQVNPNKTIFSNLSNIYTMPIKVVIKEPKTLNEAKIIFKNIHCFHNWMIQSNVSISSYVVNKGQICGKLMFAKNEYTMNVSYVNDDDYDSVLLKQVDVKVPVTDISWVNFSSLYSKYEYVRQVLNYTDQDFVVSNMSKIVKRIDNKYREHSNSTVLQYLHSQIEDNIEGSTNAIKNYEFVFEFRLTNAFMNESNEIGETIKYDLIETMIKRFNLDTCLSKSSISIAYPSINIEMLFVLNAEKIVLVNMKLNALTHIIKDLLRYNYRFFKDNNQFKINRAILYKTHPKSINDDFKYYSNLRPFFLPVRNTLPDRIFTYIVSRREYDPSKLNDYILRFNSVSGLSPVNCNKEMYENLLDIKLDFKADPNLDFYQVKYGYHKTIEKNVLVEYSSEGDKLCPLENELYFLNNSLDIVHTQSDKTLVLEYSYMDKKYETQIPYSSYLWLFKNYYFICVNKSDTLWKNMSKLIEHLQIMHDNIAFNENQDPISSTKLFLILISMLFSLTTFVLINYKYNLCKHCSKHRSEPRFGKLKSADTDVCETTTETSRRNIETTVV